MGFLASKLIRFFFFGGGTIHIICLESVCEEGQERPSAHIAIGLMGIHCPKNLLDITRTTKVQP